MLLGKLKLELASKERENAFTKEEGRFLSKDLARELTKQYSNHHRGNMMMAFYPAVVNQYSIELICELIGNHFLRGFSNRFSFETQQVIFDKYIQTHYPQYQFKVEFTEESFCSASAVMIYCYKQDDYLIPDSDPHDVMSSENNYNLADFSYSGRFLPMIKLWCDLVMNSNRLFTADIMEPNMKFSLRKELEMEAFSLQLVNEEVESLSKLTKGFRPFNKYYKLFVSDRTMIAPSINDIVLQLYENQQLSSKAVYVLDVVDFMQCAKQDSAFGLKLGAVLKELRGSTLVIFVDVPNHFFINVHKNMRETDAYQKELAYNQEMSSIVDNEWTMRMQDYNLMDIDDSLDWPIKTAMMRDLVNSLDEIKEKDETGGFKNLEELNRQLYAILRSMNLIIAYTDVMAYKQDYLFDKFFKMTQNLSISRVDLSDVSFTDKQLNLFGQSIAMGHFEINNAFENKEISEFIIQSVQTLVNERSNQDDAYNSSYAFRYLVNCAFDYRFMPDVEGNEYFKSFKENAIKMLEEAEEMEEGDEKDNIKKKYHMSVIDGNRAIANMDEDDEIGFFRDVNYKKNMFQLKKENLIELDKMIGLNQIKEQVKLFAAFVELNKIKTEKGLNPIPISKHMVFMGNPGTAKTSVALQLAKILHDKGLIPTADIKHVSRDDLVGKYVGWTARLVKEAIESAKGGILFVDEAYSLVIGEGSNSYGQEAINTFVNYLDKSDIRDSTIIIFAGYKTEMKDFIDSNPGLKSRIGFYFDFPDYTTEELIEIAKLQAEAAQYILEPEYLDKLAAEIEKCKSAKDFGNGRFVRSIFEKSVLQQSQRLLNMAKGENLTKEELITLKGEDFSSKGIDVSSSKKDMGFRA